MKRLAGPGQSTAHTPSHRALRLLRRENPKEIRGGADRHRAIKRRCASMKRFKSFTNAAITIARIGLAHWNHKRQFPFGLGRARRSCSLKVRW
jgi:transposase-like protein